MNLKINKETEVNRRQYNLIANHYSWLIARRLDNGKRFIKPLFFFGHKTQIENQLNKLK